jgi:hypothetical protein
MSLCLICENGYHSNGSPMATAISDSRITIIGLNKFNTIDNEQGFYKNLLSSNVSIKHQTNKGIKTFIVNHRLQFQNSFSRSIIFTVAGAVPLGLHSLYFLQARLDGTLFPSTSEKLVPFILDTLQDFWEDAYDKDIEYLFAFTDENNQLRSFKITGCPDNFEMEEVERYHGLLFSVIGDNSEEVITEILHETNAFSTLGLNPNNMVFISCIRALRRAINEPSILSIGGGIQLVNLIGNKAGHMGVRISNDECYLMGAKIPGGLKLGSGAQGQGIMDLSHIKYDPNYTVQQIIEIALNMKNDSNNNIV